MRPFFSFSFSFFGGAGGVCSMFSCGWSLEKTFGFSGAEDVQERELAVNGASRRWEE